MKVFNFAAFALMLGSVSASDATVFQMRLF